MTNWKLGATIGILVGLASGITFSIMNYAAALVLLYNQNIQGESLILAGIITGILVGLCAGLVYARTRDSLPGHSSTARALALASVFSLPWALSWLFTLPLINSVGPSDYMQWIHSFGIEIHWFDINTSPPQMTDLAGFLNTGAYLTTYVLIVITWIFIFGGLLGYLWDKKTQFGGGRGSK